MRLSTARSGNSFRGKLAEHIASQRDRHIAAIRADGRIKWQATTDYGKRSLVEAAVGRYKSII